MRRFSSNRSTTLFENSMEAETGLSSVAFILNLNSSLPNDLSRKSFESLFSDTFDKKRGKVFLLYEISYGNRNKSSRRFDRSNKNFLFEQKKKKKKT